MIAKLFATDFNAVNVVVEFKVSFFDTVFSGLAIVVVALILTFLLTDLSRLSVDVELIAKDLLVDLVSVVVVVALMLSVCVNTLVELPKAFELLMPLAGPNLLRAAGVNMILERIGSIGSGEPPVT